MALDISGKLIQKMNKMDGVSKAGKPWSKQEFVIETFDQFPRKICMNVMNETLLSTLSGYNVGDTINASLNIESREFNGRWYTDVRVWRFNTAGQSNPSASQQNNSGTFHADPEPGFTPDNTSDDLPF